MKEQKKWWLPKILLGTAMLALVSVGCDDDDNGDDIYDLSGTATGANERPNPVTTNATGNITGTLNATTNTLTYNITWTGLSGPVTGFHFHAPATPQQSVGVMIPITGYPAAAAGSYGNTIVLHDTAEAHFLNDMVYYNIHTGANPPGEIRGNIVATKR